MEELVLSRPVAYECKSDTDIAKLVKNSKRSRKKDKFILLLKNGKEVRRYLLPAYLNAYIRYREKKMRANSFQMEVLLFASRTMRLEDAIKTCGAQTSNNFMLFSNDKKIAATFIKKNKIMSKQIELEFDIVAATEVASAGLIQG